MAYLNFAKVVRQTTAGLRSCSRALVTGALSVLLVLGVSVAANAQTAHFTGYVPAGSNGNFGSVNIGSISTQIQLSFKFDTGGTLGSISALTEGIPSLDFVNAYPTFVAGDPANGCYSGVSYATGASCTVYATFSPTEPGNRYGAIVLNNASGTPIAVGYVSGTGVGAQVSYLPAVQSAIASSPTVVTPYGLAVDAQRNVYIADNDAGTVIKATYSAGSYTFTTIVSGLHSPESVAVDGAGNVYVPTWASGSAPSGKILIETPVGGSYVQSVLPVTGLGTEPYGVTVDGKGDVFVSDPSTFKSGIIFELSPSGGVLGSYTQTTVASHLREPTGISADISGNVFWVDSNLGYLYEEVLGSGGYTQSVLDNQNLETPVAVAVDPYENVYVADAGQSYIYLETLQTGGTYVATVVASYEDNGLQSPFGVAIDGFNNLYISNSHMSQVLRLDSSDAPTLNFASTPTYTLSADSPQSVTITNSGNATLDFTIPTTPGGNNPSIAPTSFLLNSAGGSDCPVTNYGSSAGATLLAGAECVLSVSFEPLAVGTISGEVVLNDNTYSGTQSVPLNGTGIADVFTWPSTGTIIYGQNLSSVLNATTNIPGTIAYSDSSGPVTASTVLAAGVYQLNAILTPEYGGKQFKLSMKLTVSPATLTLTASPLTVIYDSEVVTPYPYTVTGYVNGDSPSMAYSGVPTITTTAALRSGGFGLTYYNSNHGTYTIKPTWGSLKSTNYVFVFVTGVLTIAPSPTYLTVTANNLSMTRGGTVPALTYKITGFLGSDSQANQTSGQPSLSTTGTSGSPAGSYPITVLPGSLVQLYGNYAGINYVNGTLTILN